MMYDMFCFYYVLTCNDSHSSAFSPRSSPPPQARFLNQHQGEGERGSQSSEGRGEGEPHQQG